MPSVHSAISGNPVDRLVGDACPASSSTVVADTVPSVHAATENALRRNNVRKRVTFENPDVPPTNLNPSVTYNHHSIVVGGVQGYWSWEIDDYSKPLHKSQVDHQHRPGRPPRVAVDVTSQKSIESMRQASLMA